MERQGRTKDSLVADPLSIEIMVNERAAEAFLIDDPAGRPPAIYPPAESSNPKDVLIVRDHFLDTGTTIPRARWRFVAEKKSKTSKSRKKSVAVKNLSAKKGKAGKMGMAAVRRRIV